MDRLQMRSIAAARICGAIILATTCLPYAGSANDRHPSAEREVREEVDGSRSFCVNGKRMSPCWEDWLFRGRGAGKAFPIPGGRYRCLHHRH